MKKMTANALTFKIQVPAKFTAVWNSQKPFQIWYGGRGSSKSWTKAIYFLTKAMTAKYCRLVFARDTQKNVRLAQYQLFKDLANRFEIFRGAFDFKDTTMTIICRLTGNMMIGGSFEQPDSLRSVADPTDFWAEEPITRQSEIGREAFLDIVGSLRNAEGMQPQFHFTFNPISKQSWIYEDFFQNDLYDCEKLFVNYWDNPFCPQSTIDFLQSLKAIDPKRYRVDALGEWGVAYEGLIYTDYEIEDEMKGEHQFYGLDFGFTNPTALVAGAIFDSYGSDRLDYYVEELLYETKLGSNDLLREIEKLNVRKNLPMVCDNARPEMIEDLLKAGYNAVPSHKYAGSVVDGINRVKNFNLKIVRPSRNLLDELATYVYAEKKDKLLEEPAKGVDHAMDAMRYASETVKLNQTQVTDAERAAFGLL